MKSRAAVAFAAKQKGLQSFLALNLPIAADRQRIFGHSMGGHGTLIIALVPASMIV